MKDRRPHPFTAALFFGSVRYFSLPNCTIQTVSIMIRTTFLLFALLLSCTAFSQFARLQLEISIWPYELKCPEVTIYNETGAVYSDNIYAYFEEEIDSLAPGDYWLALTDCTNSDLTLMATEFTLYADSATTLDLSYSTNVYRTAIADSVVKHRLDTQFELGYMNNKWAYDQPALTSSASFSFTQSAWFAFSRHMGILTGGGFGLTHSSIAQDTTFMEQPLLKKWYEYYNYLDLHVTAALRWSTGNQQREFEPSKWTLDIGASYHLPLLFKHVARYKGNQKFMEGGLHQFTDCRVFAGIGYSQCLFFAEYRLFDFILGSYPELPTWNFGLKIDIQN